MIQSKEQVNSYLEQEVMSASPLRLRLMLIRRAQELCSEVERLWLVGDHLQASGWLIRIREILGELLDGVQTGNNPINKSVADFYVFLLKLLNRVDQSSDLKSLRTLADLLQVEGETWEAVVKKFSSNELTELGVTSLQSSERPYSADSRVEFELLKNVDDLLFTTHGINLEI